MELIDRLNHVDSREVRVMSHCTIAISRAMSGDYVGHYVNEIFWRWKIMRLNSKLAMNMTENTRLYKHAIMYKKIYINMLTQKDELAVAKTHHDIESLNLRPFSTIDEQSRHKMVSIKTYTVLYKAVQHKNRPNNSVPNYTDWDIYFTNLILFHLCFLTINKGYLPKRRIFFENSRRFPKWRIFAEPPKMLKWRKILGFHNEKNLKSYV